MKMTIMQCAALHCIVAEYEVEKVDLMTKQNKICMVWKLMLAMIVGVFVSVFSFGAVSAQAAETTVENAAEEQAPQEGSTEDNGGAALILLVGGMLISIQGVVLPVGGDFVFLAGVGGGLGWGQTFIWWRWQG